jgi:ribosomal-protein-alanine N-acetyltransferase
LFIIRTMASVDVPAVKAIEDGTLTPWSTAMLEQELQYRAGVKYVAEAKNLGRVVGWCAARVIVPEAELLKIAVHKEQRRQGIGGLLLAAVIEYLQGNGVLEMHLEVRAKNLPAVLMYRRYGFSTVGKRPGYYNEPKDDALLLRRGLG